MKMRTTIILVATGVALSFAFTAFVTPKAVKAAIATLIRDQDNAARHPFTTACNASGIASQVTCNTPIIPAGEEVVIETVSLDGVADPANTRMIVGLNITTSGAFLPYFFSPIDDGGRFQPTESEFGAMHSVKLYADPGTTIACTGNTKGANPTVSLFVQCVFSGYSVSLP